MLLTECFFVLPILCHEQRAKGCHCGYVSSIFIFLAYTLLFPNLLPPFADRHWKRDQNSPLPVARLQQNPFPKVMLRLQEEGRRWKRFQSQRRGYSLSDHPPNPFLSQLHRTKPLDNYILSAVHHIHHISLSLLTSFLSATVHTRSFAEHIGPFLLGWSIQSLLFFPGPMRFLSLYFVCHHLNTPTFSVFFLTTSLL